MHDSDIVHRTRENKSDVVLDYPIMYSSRTRVHILGLKLRLGLGAL